MLADEMPGTRSIVAGVEVGIVEQIRIDKLGWSAVLVGNSCARDDGDARHQQETGEGLPVCLQI
jgi:hypothetical protein